jgi:hypothetical protein
MTKEEVKREGLIPLFRFAANMLALWGLCANVTCRRAQRCKGDACDCVKRYAPLVPEDAREGVKAMIEGKLDGLSFDGAQDIAFDEVEAMIEWQALVAQSARGRGTRGHNAA